VKTKTAQLIQHGRKCNTRSIIKGGNELEIKQLTKSTRLGILAIANTYTGAKFDNPLTREQKMIVEECTEFVFDMFPMLSFEEIRLAFKMGSAGKFHGLNMKTYFGKFSVQFLGEVLNSYLMYRRAIIVEMEKVTAKERQEEKQRVMQEENDKARLKIIEQYKQLKSDYAKGEIKDITIRSHWAKFLVDCGAIVFTDEEKKDIWIEANELTKRELKNGLMDIVKTTASERSGIKSILKKLEFGEKSDQFDRKCRVKYAELLIAKSLHK